MADPTRIDPTAPPKSPTGTPVLSPAAVPWLLGVYGLALMLSQVLPPHTIAARVAMGVVGLGGALGLASPGWRR